MTDTFSSIQWIKDAFRDYYKPRLRKDLKRDPKQEELDQRFSEIYEKVRLTLLIGINQGVGIQFYEIAQFTLEEFNEFRFNTKEYLKERFGGGNYKLNFYEIDSFIVTVNFKIYNMESKWEHLLPEGIKA